MEVLLGISITANVAFGWFLVKMLKDSARERQAMLAESQAERASLLDRIQAPEAAVALSMSDDTEGLNNVMYDDDADFQKSMAEVQRLEKEYG